MQMGKADKMGTRTSSRRMQHANIQYQLSEQHRRTRRYTGAATCMQRWQWDVQLGNSNKCARSLIQLQ